MSYLNKGLETTINNFWQSKHGVYLIAEIGSNHEGDFEYAKRLTDIALETGVDAIKYQIYSPETLVNPKISPERYSHFKKLMLDKQEYISLAQMCLNNKVAFLASVWSEEFIDWIDPYLMMYKVGSGDLTAYPIIERIIKTSKPSILSTGLASLNEIKETIKFIATIDSSYIEQKKLALLHCVSLYPTPRKEVNLLSMNVLFEETGLVTGYSDHTGKNSVLETAVAMGAAILEFHFTDKKENRVFRDHKISFTASEVKELVREIKKIKIVQGDFKKKPSPSEVEINAITSFRRAIYAKRYLRKGEIIDRDNTVLLRPMEGYSAENIFKIIGKKLIRDKDALDAIYPDDIE